MKLKIQGVEYSLVTPQTAELLHLIELKQQSRAYSDDGRGWGMSALMRLSGDAVTAAKRGESDADTELMWMGVLAFLTRRGAGDEVTFTDALRVPLGAIEVVREPGDDVEGEGEADPTSPGPDSPETPADAPSPDAAE